MSSLLDGCNKLAREELSRVGALRSLREELSQLREHLLGALTFEIERRIYEPATSVGRGNGPTSPGSLSPPGLSRLGSVDGSARGRPRRTSSALDSTDRFDSMTSSQRRPTHRRTATYAAGLTPGTSFSEGNAADTDGVMNELVPCIAHLGGVKAALRTLRSHMPEKVRRKK